MADANARGQKVTGVDLSALNRVVAHTPEDLTVKVEAGSKLADLQSALAARGQWLPIDPPNPERLSIGALLATNASGPRRYGCGTIRDYLIGIQVALADGRVIKSGGNVVKNVAGYDLGKLFIGSLGSLGIIVEATFKLRPLPELEQFVQARCGSLGKAGSLIALTVESEVAAVVLDLHDLPPCPGSEFPTFSVVAGFAGTREEVEWQVSRATALGLADPADLEYERHFWQSEGPSPQRMSVMPSRLVETIGKLPKIPFVARAGNGVIYYRGGPEAKEDEPPVKLMRRVKDEFDPHHILPDLPL